MSRVQHVDFTLTGTVTQVTAQGDEVVEKALHGALEYPPGVSLTEENVKRDAAGLCYRHREDLPHGFFLPLDQLQFEWSVDEIEWSEMTEMPRAHKPFDFPQVVPFAEQFANPALVGTESKADQHTDQDVGNHGCQDDYQGNQECTCAPPNFACAKHEWEAAHD